MAEIRFYHLTRARLEQALPAILQKAVERGRRVVVRAGSPERAEALDTALWTFDPAAFLPHGRLKDGTEKDQPIWLTDADDNPNGADMLALVDGAPMPEGQAYTLICEMFDGNDEAAVATARARWATYKAAGHDLSYFQQDDDGRWRQAQ